MTINMITGGNEFFDVQGDDNNLSDRSDFDIESEVALCDSCKNVILKPYKEHNKLICPICMRIYDPKWEYIQIQDKETTIDELSNQGKMGFVDEDKKIKQKTTLNRQNNDTMGNLEYVNKEFDRYRQTEIIDKDNIANRLRRGKNVIN